VIYACKLEKDDGMIDWSLSAEIIFNRIRAYQPWPGAFCKAGGRNLKILRTNVEEMPRGVAENPGGKIVGTNSDGPLIACGENSLRLLEVQPEGKSAMPAVAWLNGSRLKIGDKLV
jgi:methionyl-tRNA formyltransferase